jgi:hypothetical protein
MARKRYVAVGNTWAEIGADYTPESKSHQVMPDIAPYKSMVTGEEISSRSKHREHLRRHGVIEIGNETKYLERMATAPKQLPAGRKEMIAELVYERLRHK